MLPRLNRLPYWCLLAQLTRLRESYSYIKWPVGSSDKELAGFVLRVNLTLLGPTRGLVLRYGTSAQPHPGCCSSSLFRSGWRDDRGRGRVWWSTRWPEHLASGESVPGP